MLETVQAKIQIGKPQIHCLCKFMTIIVLLKFMKIINLLTSQRKMKDIHIFNGTLLQLQLFIKTIKED